MPHYDVSLCHLYLDTRIRPSLVIACDAQQLLGRQPSVSLDECFHRPQIPQESESILAAIWMLQISSQPVARSPSILSLLVLGVSLVS